MFVWLKVGNAYQKEKHYKKHQMSILILGF